MSALTESWKSILAFLALFTTNVAVQLTTVGVPWPVDGGQWARFLLTTALGTWLVWQGPANKKRATPRRRRAPKPTVPESPAK
ncbi:hypothetical protein H7J86_26410 [Mycobacterium hackensackense]|uniref:hypothetical protein n=1 Tax=Mycobacterium hackensackense TaxID=228909 RepID=UPI002265D0F6|nr:hypothetical protein [Mycobacterium hackensackense]MCV7255703.1 hypothetical protein [Mycobacterium hackensackense]